LKDVHLCLGKDCSRDDGFEEFNCAEPIATADPNDENSLGEGQPGCPLDEYCDNGLFEPCEVAEEVERSAKADVEWPELDVSDLIEQPWDQESPTAEVVVEESYLPYITQYSFGFWYQFRFRSPNRMDVEEKRSNVHGVAGVTEGNTYCSSSNIGDRALALFFNAWN
jgi:hypothetical protein